MTRLLLAAAIALFTTQAQAATCNQATDPHSFACAEATFLGQIFPMAQMNGDIMIGDWKLLTYADTTGKPGPEFDVLVNAQNPRIPEGVINRSDKTKAGFFDWTPGRLRLNNWGRKGFALSEVQGRTRIVDPITIEAYFQNAPVTQGLQCRMFLRVGSDHLLCRWFQKSNGKMVLRGYLGFLR